MDYEKQVILVPSDLAAVGQWVDASFDYQKLFRGVHVTNDNSAGNLCRFDVITVVGGTQEWGRDMAAYVRQTCPRAVIDAIPAALPAELYFALQERISAGQRYGRIPEPPPTTFRLRWPTDYPMTTQPFGANKTYYSQFTCDGVALPGHEGIDIRAPVYDNQGSRIYACADGVVYSVHQQDDGNAYGARVRINHDVDGVRYQTVYAHLQENSVRVQAGAQVKAGQWIAISDNTGNSSGPHLHLTFKKIGATAAGTTDYPCDLVDPTPYLYWPNLRLTPTARLRIRSGPGTAHSTLAILAPGTELLPDEYDADVLWKIWHPSTWIKVRTATGMVGYCLSEYLEVMAVDPQSPAIPTPTGRFVVGLHGRADGEMQEADFRAVEQAKIESVKLTSTALPKDVERLRTINPNMFIVVRVLQVLYDHARKIVRNLTPEQYVKDFAPAPAGQTKTDIQRMYDIGIRYFELHNEPNLVIEGFGGAWKTGREFQTWWLEVRERLAAWYPGAKWGFPAMSPGSTAAGVRPVAMWDFLAECGTAIGKADWLAVHQYFRDLNEMETGIQSILYEYRRRWPDKLLIVTEFSNPYNDISKAIKGQQYAVYYNRLDDIPGIAAAYSFVSSALDAKFHAEAWREEDGTLSAIVPAVARR
ncbi:MAG: M23 family metallopeptidase [Anaerolineae bacterium]|nr:M23 family metallopeptidase [Anaerolineae bacterium]